MWGGLSCWPLRICFGLPTHVPTDDSNKSSMTNPDCCSQSPSRVWLLTAPWTIFLWPPGLPFPSPQDLPDPRVEPTFPALPGGFLAPEPPRKPPYPPTPYKEANQTKSGATMLYRSRPIGSSEVGISRWGLQHSCEKYVKKIRWKRYRKDTWWKFRSTGKIREYQTLQICT